MTDVGRPSSLTRRKGSNSYYFRRRFPADIAARIGRNEFVRSLRTGIYSDALKRLPAAEEAYLTELRRLRAQGAPAPQSGIRLTAEVPVRKLDPAFAALTCEAAERLAKRYFDAERLRLDRENVGWRAGDEWTREVEDVEHQLATLADADDPNAARWTEATEIELLHVARLRAEPQEEASRLLRQLLRRAMWQIALLRRRRLNGDYSDAITDALFAASSPTTEEHASRTSMTVGELIRRYEIEHIEPGDVSEKTAKKNRAALAIIGRFFGAATQLSDIDTDTCYEFRDTAEKLPPNFVKLFGREADLREIASEQTEAGGPRLDRQTLEHYLRTMRRLFGFAAQRRYLKGNIAEGIKPRGKGRRKEAARNSYSPEQLQKIFNAPLYVGCQDDGLGFAKPGPNVIRRSRFWVPLIALFTGLRMEEILQLTVDHVREGQDGLPYLQITPDMQVKTENGYRRVPVHSELIRIGFMELVRKAHSHENGLLFEEAAPGSDGYRSSVFSKKYATFSRSLSLKEEGKRVSFHSFRHTFRDALRRQVNVNRDLIDELCGWSRGRTTSTAYGDGAEPHILRSIVERIDHGIDLSHLYVAAPGSVMQPGADSLATS